MNPERKSILDRSSRQELWRMLAGPPLDADELSYIRDCLERKTDMETLKRLDDIASRLLAVETAQRRSNLGSPTFWLALLAAGFASFSVPWERAKTELQRWEQEFQQTRQQARHSTQQSRRNGEPRGHVFPEPHLPQEDTTSPLADALLLLPRTDARPERFPEL